MATSCDKIRDLGARAPQLIEGLGLSGMTAGLVQMALPMLDRHLIDLAESDPEELDAQLRGLAGFVLDLTSDADHG